MSSSTRPLRGRPPAWSRLHRSSVPHCSAWTGSARRPTLPRSCGQPTRSRSPPNRPRASREPRSWDHDGVSPPSGTGSGAAAGAATRAEARQMHDIGRRRAWVIWLVALSVYVLAVFHRSSLGVAGLLAADRFGITATQLAAFTVLQLLVYAGMQVPVGVAIDRYGPKRLLLGGLVLMTAGQLAFAFVTA